MTDGDACLRAAATLLEKLCAEESLQAGALAVASFVRGELGADRVEVHAHGAGGALASCASVGAGEAIEAAAIESAARSRTPAVARELALVPLLACGELEGILAARGPLRDGAGATLSLIAGPLALFLARRRLDSTERELRRQQKEQKIIFDSVPAMIWFKDRQNRILRCNRMAALQLGATPEMIEGRSTEELYPRDAARYLADDLEVIRSERPKLGIIEPHEVGSGETKWVRTDKIPYRDASGAVAGVIVFATDITQLKRAEEARREEKERLLVTLRSIADAVIATNEAGCIAIMNPVAEKLTGWTLDEARGLPLDAVVRTRLEGAHAALASRSGDEHSVTESRAPIVDGEHRVGEVVVLHDVTEKARLERELLKVAKMESIGLLAAGLAHDFNNSLTVIAANASLARASLPPASSAPPLLDEVERAVKQARDVTLQLLTFAKGGAPTRERVDLGDLVRENAGFALRGSNASLAVELAPDLLPADVDRGQFAQVVQNLVINAKQAMPEGGVVAIRGENVALDAARARALGVAAGLYVKIAVEDTGVGIEPSNLARIFDPFFTTKPSGTGLGLTTTFSIVRRHEGAITCDSRPGAGTTFAVFLPASRSAPPAGAAPERPSGPEELRARGRALVMDDQQSVRDVLCRILEHVGLETAAAVDGEAAIRIYGDALAAGRRFDIVFMDLTIPGGMGGKEAVRRVLDLDPSARVIVSSGYSNDPVMAEHERHGFCGLLAKPFALGDVVRIVARVVGSRASQSRPSSSG